MNLFKDYDLSAHSVVLTPNQRLAKIARETYDQEKLSQQQVVWESLSAYPFQSFAVKQGEKLMAKGLLPARLLLNPYQVEALWQKILGQETEDFSHLSSSAIKAWGLSHEWDVNMHSSEFLTSESTELWQQWALSFQAVMQKNGWIDRHTLLKETVDYLGAHTPLDFLPQEIILLGFADFTSFEQKFLAHLREVHQIHIAEMDFCKKSEYCTQKSFDDEEAEMEAMAQWAYAKSQLGTVACVVPQLSTLKNKISAIFGRYGEESEESKKVINISIGDSLYDYPLIRSAITGLSLLKDTLPIELITDFLLSPFFHKSFSEFSSRALLDVQLKSQLKSIVQKSDLLTVLKDNPLKDFFQKAIEPTTYRTYRQWVVFFQEHLEFLGWPGERTLNSEEFQLMAHWNTLLENFASLSLGSNAVSFDIALGKFTKIARQTLFQAKRSPEAKIDVLGILESAGLPFDYLWMSGMDEHTWPLKGMPNPFLPLALQRKLNMPHADADQNFRFCERITQQLLSCSKHIMVSYTQIQQDMPTRPSPLISAVKQADEHLVLPQFPKLAEKTKTPFEWEISEDHQGTPIDLQNTKSFGSEVFKDYTACPFRAYAKHRLHAKKAELPQIGFKALTRGKIVHKVLEEFFKQITNHQHLSEMPETELQVIASEIIHQVLKVDPQDTPDIFTAFEIKRLEKLMLSWIQTEKRREPFTVIATEETLKVRLGRLPLNLRVDRIDRIGEDQYLIIDYKTGKLNFNPHNAMDDPQLPLYCVVSSLEVNHIAFGQVRSNNVKLKTFFGQKAIWEASLLSIAEDFIQGRGEVKPKYGHQTCQYCDLTSLCRIKEKTSRYLNSE